MADPALGPFQCSVGPVGAGVLMGHGTGYVYRGIRGIGKPDKRTSDLPAAAADGEYLGTDLYAARLLEFEDLIVKGDTPADCETLLAALEAAWDGTAGVTRFRFRLASATVRYVDCRNRGFDYDLSQLVVSAVRVAPALLKAPNPVWQTE